MPVNAEHNNARYDRFVDSEPSRPSTKFQPERTRFASSGPGQNHRQNHPNFQPPAQDMYQMPVEREMRNQQNQEKIDPDYLTNDHAFFMLASSILSEIQRMDEGDMNSNVPEKSASTTLVLQEILSLVQMHRFYEALDIRLKCMPKHPSDGESHLCTIVRRCDEIFGIEMKTLLLFKGTSNNDSRDDQPRFQNPWQNQGASEDAHTFYSLPKKQFNGHTISEQNDLTDHIIRENDWEKRVPKTASNDTDQTFPCETLSNSGSQFNDGEVYDIIVAEAEEEEETEDLDMDAETEKHDNDDKSVASMYSISREKSLQAPGHKNRKFVSVKAPETLPANFMFEARMNDEVFMVHVPKGGVKKGEIFKSPALNLDSRSVFDPTGRVKRLVDMNAPSGRWRDGLFNIFEHGLCHPMLLTSFLCTHVALAQIMARLQIDNSGNRTTSLRSRVNFNLVRIVPTILALLNGVFIFLLYRAFRLHLGDQIWIFMYSSIPIIITDLCLYGYFIYLTSKTRHLVCQEYNIDHYSCIGYQDELLSFFLTPFVVAQMGRHTADYGTYAGIFCTNTGLSDHIEVKLPSDNNEYCAMENLA